MFTREVITEAIRRGPGFKFNTLSTTIPFTTSPAYADILVRPSNFLPCKGGPFALCYYSGPDGNLPCHVARQNDPLAECDCVEIAHGAYYVDINAILDVDTYLQTVESCGRSGSKCTATNSAPVCTIINANKLFPGADLISVFSSACFEEEGLGQTTCAAGVYAGCMTAPCYRDPANEAGIVQCLCPTFDGPFQVGQSIPQDQCDLGRKNVWSAAYAVRGTTFPAPDKCIPDDRNPDVGSPLWPVDTTLTPDSPICQQVCGEYESCTRNRIELGFTCDATLCTSGCSDQDLVKDACDGLSPPACQLSSIIAVEEMAGCSCCASQICGCEPNERTNEKIYRLNERQRLRHIEPQCDKNGTLCGEK